MAGTRPATTVGDAWMAGRSPKEHGHDEKSLRLPHAVQHCGRERLGRRFAAPQDELEGGEEPLALGQCDIDQVFKALRRCSPGPTQQDRMAVDRHAIVAFETEM